MDNEIRVVIADDQEGMRLILRKMIDKAQGFTICAEADSGDKVPALVEQYKPHVCFLDVEMPGMTGIECAKSRTWTRTRSSSLPRRTRATWRRRLRCTRLTTW